jgi:hypothetical protein
LTNALGGPPLWDSFGGSHLVDLLPRLPLATLFLNPPWFHPLGVPPWIPPLLGTPLVLSVGPPGAPPVGPSFVSFGLFPSRSAGGFPGLVPGFVPILLSPSVVAPCVVPKCFSSRVSHRLNPRKEFSPWLPPNIFPPSVFPRRWCPVASPWVSSSELFPVDGPRGLSSVVVPAPFFPFVRHPLVFPLGIPPGIYPGGVHRRCPLVVSPGGVPGPCPLRVSPACVPRLVSRVGVLRWLVPQGVTPRWVPFRVVPQGIPQGHRRTPSASSLSCRSMASFSYRFPTHGSFVLEPYIAKLRSWFRAESQPGTTSVMSRFPSLDCPGHHASTAARRPCSRAEPRRERPRLLPDPRRGTALATLRGMARRIASRPFGGTFSASSRAPPLHRSGLVTRPATRWRRLRSEPRSATTSASS